MAQVRVILVDLGEVALGDLKIDIRSECEIYASKNYEQVYLTVQSQVTLRDGWSLCESVMLGDGCIFVDYGRSTICDREVMFKGLLIVSLSETIEGEV